jgi:hypothetical protein
MYNETRKFLSHVVRQKAIWTDGELWTSVAVATAFGFWMHHDPSVMTGISQQLGDILTVSGIVFGFIMTTLALYADVSTGWSREKRVQRVVGKIFDWQVLSVATLMAQMGYLIVLRLVDGRVNFGLNCRPLWYAILVFLTVYAALQIWNHTLIAWWAFRDPTKLEPKPEKKQETPIVQVPPEEQYVDR